MSSVTRTLFRGKPAPRPRFAAGLIPAESDVDREFRRLASFRSALATHRRDEVTIDEAAAILERIELMGRTEAQLEAPQVRALTIGKIAYGVEPIPAGEFGTVAFRLVKDHKDGAVYDVVRTRDGLVECDCPSYEMSYRGTCDTCKHGKALIAAGLIEAPSYAPAGKGGAR